MQIIDVRSKKEYTVGHIESANHLFLGTLIDNLDKVSTRKTVVIYCQSGDRASIAYSLLRSAGFESLKNYAGGINDWLANGNTISR